MQNFETQRAIVAAARSWVGTPYQHQQMLKGVGVDCVGVILGTGFDSGTLTITEEEWAPFANYSRTPNPRKMERAMRQFLLRVDPAEAPRPGLVAWLQWRAELPMHLGVIGAIGDRPTLIHAYGDMGKCVEHDFSPLWQARVGSWWRYPGDQ